MSRLKLNLIYILIFINSFAIKCLIYPINKDIDKSNKNKITTIVIKTKEQYINYILNYEYVASLIYFNPFENFSEIINKFDQASSYQVLNKWIFLRIECEKSNDIYQLFEKNDKTMPLIKIFIKSKEIKALNSLIHFEMPELLEFLLKYSDNPIIEISDKDNIKDFYNKYGTFSPLIIYDKENTELISCIIMLAKKKYKNYFYFGTIPIQLINEKMEKIIFDNDNYPISMTWDKECDDIDSFLSQNIYPLVNKVDKALIYKLKIDPKILVTIICNLSKNNKNNNFINNYYKKNSYINRKLAFGYIDYNENNSIISKYNIEIKNENDIILMLYDFNENIYYIDRNKFNFNEQKEQELYEYINELCSDLSQISFTSGSLFKDLIRKIGLNKIINLKDKNQLRALAFSIFIIISGFFYLKFISK